MLFRSMKKEIQDRFDKGYEIFFGYKQNNELVGYVTLKPFFPGYKHCEVYWLAVKKKYQGKGIGSKLMEFIEKYAKKNKVVIVTGGGHTAREYISALRKEKLNENIYSWVGIATTKLNARLVASYFKKIKKIPNSLKDVKNGLKRSNLVVCGALGFQPGMTSDGDAAQISEYLKADKFINMTNGDGLYNKDPKLKSAKFIPKISFDDFWDIAKNIDFKATFIIRRILVHTTSNPCSLISCFS